MPVLRQICNQHNKWTDCFRLIVAFGRTDEPNRIWNTVMAISAVLAGHGSVLESLD